MLEALQTQIVIRRTWFQEVLQREAQGTGNG
jgi:hypothetical protein